MAASLPDNLWIGILIMAVIILALLWNDRISRSSGSSSGGGSSSSNDGPSVSMRRSGSTTVGEEFELRGTYDSGDGSISDYSLTINGRDISDRISSLSGGTFATDVIEVPDVDTVECDIQVSATYGTADDSISFNPTRPPEPDGPDLEVNIETQDADPGEDNGAVTITADPVPGDNPIQETVVELPDFGASDSSTGNSTASIRQTGISPGEGYRYVAQTTDGETPPVDETGTFRIRGHHEGNLEVEANHEIVDPEDGEVRIFAEVVSAPAEIEEITIEFRSVGAERWRPESAEADSIEIVEEFSPGSYEYRGVADTMNRRDTDRDTFQIGEGGASRDDYPELVRIINQNTSNNLGDLGGFQGDEDVMGILEQILEQVDSSGSDGEAARAGMDAYQLLLAMNALGADLDGDDNQEIVAELRQIRQQMGDGGMSSDDLENALRAVLQDVFGQDLQGVIEGLDLADGFDEDAIVDAIENKDMDLSEVTDRLDNIEQAVAQIQSQGGDLGDVEQKLDGIESAVRDLQVDDQIFQDLTAEIRSLRNEGIQVNVDMDNPLMIKLAEDIRHSGDPQAERQRILQRMRQESVITRTLLIQLLEDDESGREGNKNEQKGSYNMPDSDDIEDLHHELDQDIEHEIEHLKEEYDQMETLIQEEGEIENLEKRMDHEIEELVEHLKKARQVEHHLVDLFNEAANFEEQDFADELNHNVHQLNAQIKEARTLMDKFMDDFSSFKSKLEERRSVFQSVGKVEEQLQQQEDQLERTEQMMENAIDNLSQESNVKKEHYT